MLVDIEKLTLDDIKIPGEEEEKIVEKETKEEEKKEEKTEEKKEPEAEKKEEKVEEKKEEAKAEVKAEEKNEKKEDNAEALLKTSQEEVEGFNSLSAETGVKLTSDSDIVDSLKELAQYRSGKIPGVSPTLVKAIEIEKQGGNLNAFFRALSREPDKMSEVDLLRESFLEKSERAKTNPSLASKDFERSMKQNYGSYLTYESIKDAEEKKEFYEKNSEDIDYQKELYKNDVEQSKKAFKELQEKFPVEQKQAGMTQAQLDELSKLHLKESSAAFSAFKAVDIPIEGEDKFAVGLTDKTKPIVEGWLKDPEKFLNAIGFSPDKIDYARLRDVMAVIADISSGDFGKRFQGHVLASKNVKTLEEELDKNPKKIERGASEQNKDGDIWDKIGDAFEAKRVRK